jgi:thioredoxin-dependent peroxiredoxin
VDPVTSHQKWLADIEAIDSMQLTARHKVATPVNWKHGDDVIILTSVSDEEAKQKYPGAGGHPGRIYGL